MSFNCQRQGTKKSKYPNYLCDSETRKWVKINTPRGTMAVEKVKSNPRQCRGVNIKSQNEMYICNPATSRFVKSNGRVGKIVSKYYGHGTINQPVIKVKKVVTKTQPLETIQQPEMLPPKLTGKDALLALKKVNTAKSQIPILPQGYIFVKRLGSGLSGDLYLAHPSNSDHRVVIKQYHEKIVTSVGLEMIELVNSMKKINSEWLLKYYDSQYNQQTQEFAVVMDYFNGHNLTAKDIKLMDLETKLQLILQAILGLNDLQIEFGFSHQDLKPSSLMVSDDYSELKYIGYGLTADIDSWKKNYNLTSGAPYYRSPENIVIKGQAQLDELPNLTKAGDVWALGAIIYYLLTGLHAFQNSHQESVKDINYTILATEPDYQLLPIECRQSQIFMTMLKGMLFKDSKSRFKITEILDLYEQAYKEIMK